LAVGETFGEWGPEEVKEKLGFVPPGLEELSSLWSAPMPDYALPGQRDSMSAVAMTYILSAVIGVIVCGGLLYAVGKKVAKDWRLFSLFWIQDNRKKLSRYLIIIRNMIPDWMKEVGTEPCPCSADYHGKKGFVGKTIDGIFSFMQEAFVSETY
jgi:hypothetical protein